MISASSEYNKRIGLDGNNLFKFKAPRSIQHEGGDEMNEEILSSPSGEDESMEQRLMLDQAIKNSKQQEKKGKTLNQTQDYSNHNVKKSQLKKTAAQNSQQPSQIHLAPSALLHNLHEKHSNSNQFNGEDNLFIDDIEDDDAKLDHSNDIFGIHNHHQNSSNLIHSRETNKRISIQSESTPALGGDAHDQDIDELENHLMDDEDLHDQCDNENVEEDEEELEDDDEDGQDDDEAAGDEDNEDDDSDQDEQSHEESVTKKKGQNNINSAKSPPAKTTKNTRKQSKKPGRKGHQGRGKHHDAKSQHANAAGLNHNGKRCHNQFCKFPYKGDLKRVKIKFTSEYVHLCQKCTERFKLKCYCLYCGQVYYDSNEGDGKVWIQCEDCQYWLHQECEKENGLSDIDTLIEDDSYKFFCMRCRDKNKPQQQDKLQLNIQKAKEQIAKTFQAQNGVNLESINNQASNGNSSPSSQKQMKRQYKKQLKEKCQVNQQKNKGKVSLASLQKQLNKPIFAPKPDQIESTNGVKNNNLSLGNQNTNSTQSDQVVEPKKQKKICSEESKQNGVHAQNHGKGSPQIQNANNNHHNLNINSSDYYSPSLFLKAKKLQQQQDSQLQNNYNNYYSQHIQYNNINLNNITQQDNQAIHNDNSHTTEHNQNQQNIQSAINPYSHHQRQRKEDAMNYMELPYKKQTIKENTSKRVYYHYSVLQELLTPLSISMTLAQEDINEDLQILRSLIIEGRRICNDDGQSSQLNSHIEENQINLSSSSQYDSCHNKSSPQQFKGQALSEYVNLTPVKRKGVIDDKLNTNSPIMSHH